MNAEFLRQMESQLEQIRQAVRQEQAERDQQIALQAEPNATESSDPPEFKAGFRQAQQWISYRIGQSVQGTEANPDQMKLPEGEA